MFRTHLVFATRNLLKNKTVSLISVLGLTVALTACLFTGHYLLFEFSYDRFFAGSERIYRVNLSIQQGAQQVYHGSKTPRNLFFALQKEIPEVEANTFTYFEHTLLRYQEVSFNEQRVLWVEEGFEKVFSLPMVAGKAEFNRPLTAIISASKAKAFFGDKSPIGQILQANEGMPMEVTGVYADLPANTHLQADYFFSIKTWQHYGYMGITGDWVMNEWWNYLRLKPGASISQVEKKLTALLTRNLTHLKDQGRTGHFSLQPLPDLHFIQGLAGEFGAGTHQDSLYNVLLIGMLILLVAWVNLANLTVAQTEKRSRQVGICIILGATWLHLWVQSLFENILLNLLAVSLAFAGYQLLLPTFADYFELPLSHAYLPTIYQWLFLGSAFAVGVLFFSFFQTQFNAAVNTQTNKTGKPARYTLQKTFVIGQLVISMCFISGSLLVYKQLNYMQQYPLGMDLEEVVVMPGPASLNMDTTRQIKFVAFREQLLQYPEFSSATATMSIPGQEPRWNKVTLKRVDSGNAPASFFMENDADGGFVNTFRLQLIAGRNFSPLLTQNRHRLIINEQARQLLGFATAQEAIGKRVWRKDQENSAWEIIGVIEDFHNQGLHQRLYPLILNNTHPFEFGYYSFRISSPDKQKALNYLRMVWNKDYPKDPFTYFFAKDYFSQQYHAEARLSKFYSIITFLALTISGVGLYGLLLFFLHHKQKEIAIRKVNGALVIDILLLLNIPFLRWCTIAFVIACPMVYLAMNQWLLHFAYRTKMSWWIFVLTGLITLLLTLCTVSWQSYQAARRNPLKALQQK